MPRSSLAARRSFAVRHRPLLIVLAVVVLLGVIAGGLFVAKEWRHQAWLDRERAEGFRLLEEGKVAEALAPLSRVVRARPDDRELLETFADARESVPTSDGGHLLAAIRTREMIAELDRTDVDAVKALLRLYAMVGYAAEADRTADEVLLLEPDDPDAISVKISVATSRGRTADAERLATRLTSLEDADISSLRARLQVLSQENLTFDEAIRRVRTWTVPANLAAAREAILADMQVTRGLRDDALASVNAAVRLRPTDPGTVAAIADVLDLLGDPARGSTVIEDAVVAGRDKEALVDLAIDRHVKASRLDAASAEVARATDLLGRDSRRLLEWRLRLAALGVADPSIDAAAEAYRRSIAGLPAVERRSRQAWLDAVLLAARGPRSSPAFAEALDAALELAPGDVLLRLLRGEQRLQEGNARDAVVDLRVAFQTSGGSWVRAGLVLAVALESQGAPGAAIEVASQLLGRSGNQLPVVSTFGSLWANLAATGRSIDDLRLRFQPNGTLAEYLVEVLERSEGDPRVAVLVAEHGAAIGEAALVERGLAVLDRPAVLPPPIVERLGRVAASTGSPRAESAIRRLEAADPTTLAIAALRAQRLAQEGRPDAGYELLAAAVAEPGRSMDRVTQLGVLAEFAGRSGLPQATSLRGERLALLLAGQGPPLAILSTDEVWQDEQASRSTIDRLAESLGRDHPEVLLAESRWTLLFRRDERVRRDPLVASLLALVDAGSEDPRVPFLLARLLASAPEPDAALIERAIRRRLELRPNDLSPYPELVQILLAGGKSAAAFEVASEQLARAGRDPVARRQAASAMLAAGRAAEAADAMRALVAELGEESDRLALAQCLTQTGSEAATAEAGRVLREAASRSDATSRAVLAAADWELAQGQPDAAWQRLLARQEASGDLDMPLLKLVLGLQSGRVEDADRAAAELLALRRSDAGAVATIATWMEVRDRLDEAVALVREGLLRDVDQPELVSWAVTRSSHPGWRLEESPELREALASAAPGLLAVAELERQATNAMGNLEPSPSDLERAVAIVEEHPRLPAAWRLAVLLHSLAGRGEVALDLARRAAAAFPESAPVKVLLAETLLQFGRAEEARLAVEELARTPGADPAQVALLRASVLLELRRPAEALAVAEGAIATGGGNPLLATLRGRALVSLGRIDDALAALGGDRRALLAIAARAIPRLAAPSIERLLAATEEVRATDPRIDLDLAVQISLAFARTGDPASLDLADALLARVDPAIPSIHLVRGDLLAGRGDLAGAVENYRRALDAVSAADRERMRRWSELGESERASLASVHSLTASALNNIAYRQVELRQVSEESLSLIDEASLLMPDTPALRDTRALVLLALKRVPEARAEAEAAVLASPDDPAMRATLASVLLEAEAYAEARRQIIEGLALLDADPGSQPALRKTLERLEQRIPRGGEAPPERRQQLPKYLDATGG
ncbi:MAG: hypothetical protein FJ257_10280 [Phycisphaerae bacterium]|nr:hypothetical protein [Phycisphaerae bacterium]